MRHSLRQFIKHIVEKNPFTWYIAWKIIHLSVFLPHDEDYLGLKHFINLDHGLFLDIGANDGISALSFRRLNKNWSILSLEPNTIHEKSLMGLMNKIQPFDYLLVGAGEREMEVQLYTPVYKGIYLHTSTSALLDEVNTGVEKIFGTRTAKNIRIVKSKAKIIKVDSLLLEPTIIKIDVEGFEYRVLLGARKTIEQFQPILLIEVTLMEIGQLFSYLNELGYLIFVYDVRSDRFINCDSSSLSIIKSQRNVYALPNKYKHLIPIIS